jgi:hypothetical protein
VFPLSQLERSSPYAAKRALALFLVRLFTCTVVRLVNKM